MTNAEPYQLSVIICCHNSAQRLPQTLQYLARQQLDDDLLWELMIVNNNSTDETERVAKRRWHELGSPAPIRVIDEPTPGQATARKRGVFDARGEFVLFCDDDNYLDPNYFSIALKTINKNPNIALVAGNGHPAWQAEAPEWIRHCLRFLACTPQSQAEGDAGAVGFYTAGMILRKHAVTKIYRTTELCLSGRVGTKHLAGGEDIELCLLLSIHGYQLWGSPELRFGHDIATERLTWKYVVALRYAMGTANAKLTALNFVANHKEKKLKSSWFVQTTATLLRTVVLGIKYPFSKLSALEFWYHLGRLSVFISGPKKYRTAIKELTQQRNRLSFQRQQNSP